MYPTRRCSDLLARYRFFCGLQTTTCLQSPFMSGLASSRRVCGPAITSAAQRVSRRGPCVSACKRPLSRNGYNSGALCGKKRGTQAHTQQDRKKNSLNSSTKEQLVCRILLEKIQL